MNPCAPPPLRGTWVCRQMGCGQQCNRMLAIDECLRTGGALDYEPMTVMNFNSLQVVRGNYGADDYSEEAGIVHECIHGLHDFYGAGFYYPRRGGSNFITRSENEAAAYVAGCLYHLYETGTPLQGDAAIFDIAALIAKRIMSKRGAFVTTAEARALRVAIALNTEYKFGVETLTTADGP